jgi:hypothetical protein
MKIADIKIVESLNQPAPWEWTDMSSLDTFQGQANINEYADLFVTIEDTGGDEWEISFTRQSPHSLMHTSVATGQGDEFKVFATVVAMIKDWWEKITSDGYRPDQIKFTASKQAGDSPSRSKLYTRFAQKFANQIGYNVAVNQQQARDVFLLTNPDA